MARTEREALIALYDSTGGPTWTKSGGWATGNDLSQWHGIKTNHQGRVVEIDLCNNNLQGSITKELGKLEALQFLHLQRNKLSGSIPPQLGDLSALLALNLGGNELAGLIPPGLGQNGALRTIKLWGNQLTGAIPGALCALKSLTEIDVSANQLEGIIPPGLGQLSDLQTLKLWGNQLTGEDRMPIKLLSRIHATRTAIPTLVSHGDNLSRELSSSVRLELSLTCPIPSELGNLGTLNTLSLWKNKLSGSIPKELGNLHALKVLALSINNLSDFIPPELGGLGALETLDVRGNQLIGSIPSDLGNMGALKLLGLSSNRLTGTIPKELGNLTTLTDLSLSGNNLEGPIPKELGDLSALTRLTLHTNVLIGDAPSQPLLGGEISRWQEKLRDAGEEEPWVISLVEFMVALWHFLLPIIDDITDVILLWATFEGGGGLWWACFAAFVLADIERVILLVVTILLTMCWAPFALLETHESRGRRFAAVLRVLNGGRELTLEEFLVRHDAFGNEVRGHRPSALRWPVFDAFMWTLVGPRSKSGSLMKLFGLAGNTSVNRMEQSGFGLSLIDRIIEHHPYSMLGRGLFAYPHGHHLPDSGNATRRSRVMLRAVGETVVVDSLFFALSLSSETWEDGLSIGVYSLIFSVLELVTEFQYYAAEARVGMVMGERK
ncbi:unnamed protein product [Ectocarpus sp. 12 AP-2014]